MSDTNIHESSKTNLRAMTGVFIGGILLMGLKFLAWYLTQSTAILTDALESIVNVVAAGFALYSIRLSAMPKDPNHPYGHGKVEFFAAGFEGGMIILAALSITYESVKALFEHHEVKSLDIGIILTAVAGGINMLMGYFLIRTGKKHHSLTLVADGKHLLSDTLSSAGLLGGLILILIFKINWLDSVLALGLAALIFVTGVNLVRKSIAGLMDEADFQQVQDVINVLKENRKDEWIDIHNMRILKYGHYLHIDCHITLPWYNTLEKSHDEVKRLETLLNEKMGGRVEIFIHADPCLPECCAGCKLTECKERKEPFRREVEWTLENITSDMKHTVS